MRRRHAGLVVSDSGTGRCWCLARRAYLPWERRHTQNTRAVRTSDPRRTIRTKRDRARRVRATPPDARRMDTRHHPGPMYVSDQADGQDTRVTRCLPRVAARARRRRCRRCPDLSAPRPGASGRSPSGGAARPCGPRAGRKGRHGGPVRTPDRGAAAPGRFPVGRRHGMPRSWIRRVSPRARPPPPEGLRRSPRTAPHLRSTPSSWPVRRRRWAPPLFGATSLPSGSPADGLGELYYCHVVYRGR